MTIVSQPMFKVSSVELVLLRKKYADTPLQALLSREETTKFLL